MVTKRFFLALILCLFLSPANAETGDISQTPKDIADHAYNDLIARFWSGSASGGYIATLSHQKFEPLPRGVAFFPQTKAYAWWYSIGTEAVYAYWKETGSADALARLNAEWSWVKSFYLQSDFSVCGVNNKAPANFALDDTAWNALWLLNLYDASHDPVALAWAKSALDCGYAEWYSSDLGGGLWYSDAKTSKSSYQGQFILDMLLYDQFAGSKNYLAQAESLDAWMASAQRVGQTFYGNAFPNDGLYWADIAPNGVPFGNTRPYDIHEASSVTFLEGNMAMAVVDNRLFQITHNAVYKTRVDMTVSAIEKYLADPNGAFLDDRDAMTNAAAADFFAREVVPTLADPLKSKIVSMYQTTAKLVYSKARLNDRTYSGAWAGPNDGSDIWSTKIGNLSTQLNVSATAVMWPISALAMPQ